MRHFLIFLPLLFFGLLGCGSLPFAGGTHDEFLWLEDIEGKKSLDWVRAANQETLGELQKDQNFAPFKAQALKILTATDRIPRISLREGYIYNFWQDDKHIRGIWRRTTPDSFRTARPQWEVFLDLDELARVESENWVAKRFECLPRSSRCLISLSRGGKDAVVVREFDLDKKSFLEDGFQLNEAKSSFAWLNKDQILVGTDFGPGSQTKSGYPRIVKLWNRAEELKAAKTIFEGKDEDVSVMAFTYLREQNPLTVVTRYLSFYENKKYIWSAVGEAKELSLPLDSDVTGWIENRLILSLKSDWKVKDETLFKSGSLVAVDISDPNITDFSGKVSSIFSPDEKTALRQVAITKNQIFVTTLEDVKSRLSSYRLVNGNWTKNSVKLPEGGSLSIAAFEMEADPVYLSFSGFISSSRLYEFKMNKLSLVKSLPERFDTAGLSVEQRFAVSRDGTKVPYFIVGKNLKSGAASAPTLLYGYGGFEVSMTPWYPAEMGKLWLERGGTFALANIRGGGEYGPAWHQAAIKGNRQRSFDDFAAVAEDLIKTGVTSAKQLGIMGGSNGGLLVGASFVQRPDLFKAVVCQVPLLDMLRYTKLLAGSSWIAEYGDPELPEERKFLREYSPYHNLKSNVQYPRPLFITSTKDDRVHPAHARKMAAKMKSFGQPLFYYENIEGGHSASANLEQRAFELALTYVYLSRELGLN